ncbi:MAG: AAA family ATPase [Tannerellaceae bacterium]|nr:AAA family ATPase [Tannerellaceae bacterium]
MDIDTFLKAFRYDSRNLYINVCVLVELDQRRKIATLAHQLYQQANDMETEIPQLISATTGQLTQFAEGPSTAYYTLDEAIQGVRNQIERNCNQESPLTGTPTGFTQLDKQSGGLQGSDLIVIVADTSQGKTSLSLSLALNAARTDAGVAIYSLEMKKEQIAARLIATETGIPVNQLLYSPLPPGQIEQIEKGLTRLYGLPVYFDDRSTSQIDTIITSIRNLKMKYNIKGAVVDYLQIMNVNMKGSNKEAQMGEVSRRLKNLALELDIWIMALSQLNRDPLHPAPSLGRLRDSGQIAEAADVVMLIYRPEVYNRTYGEPFQWAGTANTALIEVAKGRNIGLTKFLCGFNPQTCRFYELHDIPRLEKTGKEEPF